MSRRLLVLPADRVSEWVDKGEVVERYWNPGNTFDRIDVVTFQPGDRPDAEHVQAMAGRAEIHLHAFPVPDGLFRKTLGYRPLLLRSWIGGAVALARSLNPSVIRCYGAGLNAFAARAMSDALEVPYAVSLHINPDEDVAGRARRLSDRLRFRAMESVARSGLRGADLVLPVYEPIVPYLRRLGVKRYEVAYNVVAGRHLRVKDDYGLHEPVRVISVGRLFEAKNPINLIHAVEELPGVELLVVGDGPLRQELQRQAGARVRFAPAIPNAELCGLLAEQDLFATHTDQWEIPKTILEALLTGLPMLLNHRRGKAVPELQAGMAHFVDDSVAGYREGLRALLADHGERERLGRRARVEAQERWAPERTERRYAEIYERLLEERGRIPSSA